MQFAFTDRLQSEGLPSHWTRSVECDGNVNYACRNRSMVSRNLTVLSPSAARGRDPGGPEMVNTGQRKAVFRQERLPERRTCREWPFWQGTRTLFPSSSRAPVTLDIICRWCTVMNDCGELYQIPDITCHRQRDTLTWQKGQCRGMLCDWPHRHRDMGSISSIVLMSDRSFCWRAGPRVQRAKEVLDHELDSRSGDAEAGTFVT